jgi:hypothetical protein
MSNEPNKGAQRAAQLAQLAKGLADIIKGAAAGGLHGAAAGAVKAFAPQIIKALIYILLFFLFIPVIIFFAVPHMFFQMPSVNDPDVVNLTSQAMYLESLYGSIEDLSQEEAEKIIQSLAAGHDEVISSIDLSSIDRYWLIAISAVLHEQGMTVTEDDVRGLISKNLNESHTIEIWLEQIGTDENEEAIYEERSRINITITGGSHDALMDALGFTQFQKDWAYFLYENIKNAPSAGSDNGSFPGGGTHNNVRDELAQLEDKEEFGGGSAIIPLRSYISITSEFGSRDYAPDPQHTGIDFSANAGTPIYAAMDGIVLLRLTDMSGFGHHIVLYHGGEITTMYAHMSAFGSYNVGDEVDQGDVIGYVGRTGLSTGNHLHFEYQIGGTAYNPQQILPLS